jgi:hypothetical protein
MFPWASPSSHVVPQYVPNNTSILSHMICPKFDSHVYKLKKMGQREAHLFLFCNRDPKRCFYWGGPNVPKTIGDVPINVMCLLKKEKKKKV